MGLDYVLHVTTRVDTFKTDYVDGEWKTRNIATRWDGNINMFVNFLKQIPRDKLVSYFSRNKEVEEYGLNKIDAESSFDYFSITLNSLQRLINDLNTEMEEYRHKAEACFRMSDNGIIKNLGNEIKSSLKESPNFKEVFDSLLKTNGTDALEVFEQAVKEHFDWTLQYIEDKEEEYNQKTQELLGLGRNLSTLYNFLLMYKEEIVPNYIGENLSEEIKDMQIFVEISV